MVPSSSPVGHPASPTPDTGSFQAESSKQAKPWHRRSQGELHEELGIQIGTVIPWKVEMVDYPHALVRLHFGKVFDWTGELDMREGQSFSWQRLPLTVEPVLPGTIPVLQWLAHEQQHPGPTHLPS
jgi:hypothetical protein